MTVPLTNPIAILNIVELVLTIIVSGLIGDMACVGNTVSKIEFVYGVVYGYLIISTIVAIAIFLQGTLERYLRVVIHAAGAILWLTASALMLESADNGICSVNQEWYDRAIAGGIIGLAVFITHTIDIYFSWRFTE